MSPTVVDEISLALIAACISAIVVVAYLLGTQRQLIQDLRAKTQEQARCLECIKGKLSGKKE